MPSEGSGRWPWNVVHGPRNVPAKRGSPVCVALTSLDDRFLSNAAAISMADLSIRDLGRNALPHWG